MAQDFRKNNLRYQKYFLNIKAIYSTRQDLRMFLEILLSITAVAFFVLFAIRPTLITIGKLLTEIKEKQSILTQMTTKIDNLQVARTLFENSRSQLDILALAIPDQPNPENIIRQIEGLAQNNNLTVVKISAENINLSGKPDKVIGQTSTTTAPAGFNYMTISFSVSGQYSDAMNFLKQVENMRRPVSIQELIVNSGLQSGNITISAVTQGIYYDGDQN